MISQGKSVVVMVPPHGEERIELHHHWEEVGILPCHLRSRYAQVLLATMRDVRFPKLRVLNMAQVRRAVGVPLQLQHHSQP